MNFWIESRRPDLLKLLEHVDLVTLNDGEARQLTEQTNLGRAARWIMERVADNTVVIKKGGAWSVLSSTALHIFFAPGPIRWRACS